MKSQTVAITAPNFQTADFGIIGTAPYVSNRFSKKAQELIREKHAEGATARGKKKREPKDFGALYLGAIHVSKEGWPGIPASAFRCALIAACKVVGFAMTRAKLAVFVVADGIDAEDGTPLVRIEGEHRQHEAMTRNATGVVDLRVRAMWEEWSARVRVRFDGDMFTLSDIANLLSRAGQQVGIGEGRADSKASCGMGWGSFELESEQ